MLLLFKKREYKSIKNKVKTTFIYIYKIVMSMSLFECILMNTLFQANDYSIDSGCC